MKHNQILSVIISNFLIFIPTLNAANLEIDTTAPSSNRASLENAPNGVPIVNIVAPNGQGLSHNKFKNYNVEKKGLILNNSKVVTNTQLSGYISYNKNLTGNNAKLILNEVTGTSRSLLRGYTEVAGQAADVIVANPNGITVNGGGFINTPKATLTTGNPFVNGGLIQGFDVSRGDILIEGDGFNADNIDQVNLYTMALQLNAKLYAKKLNIVTGKNSIALDGVVTSKDNIGTGISIDSSLLGGIYANTISLVSNDKGVGVNLPHEVYAQQDLFISVNGDIQSSSQIGADTISIESQNNFSISEESIIEGKSSLNIKTKENINNKGKIYSKNDLTITTNTLENHNLIQADDDIVINTQVLNNRVDGVVYAQDSSTITSNTIDNEGIIAGRNLDIEVNTIDNRGALYTTNDMTIKAQSLTNYEMIRSNDEINLLIEDTLTNTKDGVIYADGKITLAANEAKDKINTISNSGLIQSHDAIDITAKKLENIASTPTYKNTTTNSTQTVSKGGSNDFDIVKTTLKTQAVDIPSDPALILADGDIAIDVETLNNFYSLISSDGDIVLNAISANNVGQIIVTNTTVVTTQYRNESYCSIGGPSGACFQHKNRAGYRGTFTNTSTTKLPVTNYGIQAKRNITGNVVTLNNVNGSTGTLTDLEIAQKKDLSQTIESNAIDLQTVVDEFDNSNEEASLALGEVKDMDVLVDGIQTADDLVSFKADLSSMQDSLQSSIDKDQTSIASLEAIIAYSKTLNTTPIMIQEISILEGTLSNLKNNVISNEANILTFKSISDAIVVVADVSTQKQALIDIDTEVRTIISNNSQIIVELGNTKSVDKLVSELETISDNLQSEIKESLNLQQATTQSLVSADDGLYR